MTHARIPDFSQPAPIRRLHPGATGRRQPVDRREAAAPVRPDTAHSRALRLLQVTGEALTAVLIIAGGVFAYGYLPPL